MQREILDRRTAQEAGFHHHFVKPAGPQALLACIQAWDDARLTRGGLAPEAA
ncbi:hypothetical protein J7E62_16270 [Variovorax paradoxus]|nr:hypothetical protein [Variovorax paradoxus]